MGMTKSGFALRLAELRNRYVLSLPDRLAAIAEKLSACQQCNVLPDRPAAIAETLRACQQCKVLPDRLAAIEETLRACQQCNLASGSLEQQFHTLAGTAGTFGLFAIAATAIDGFDECSDLDGARIDGDARYLWSLVEELENEIVSLWRSPPAEPMVAHARLCSETQGSLA